MSVRNKLLVGLLAGLVPLIALGLTALLVVRGDARREAHDEAVDSAEAHAAVVDRQVRSAQEELSGVAEWPDLILPSIGVARGAGTDQRDAAQSALETSLTWWRGFVHLVVVDGTGAVIAATDESAAVAVEASVGSAATENQTAGGWDGLAGTYQIARPLAGADGDAALVAFVDLGQLSVGLDPAGTAKLIDRSIGAVLSAQDGVFVVERALEPEQLSFDDTAVAPVGVQGWLVVVDEAPADGGPFRSVLVALVLTGLILAVLAPIVAWRVGGAISARLRSITDAAAAIRAGDLDHRVGGHGDDELGTVSASFDDMADSLVTDISRRREMETLLVQQALHDPLTGLANRAKLVDRLGDALLHSARTGRSVGLLFCDLDGFKAVNDQHGHNAGDDLLMAVADRFRTSVRPADTVARFGGDEFVVLCSELNQPEDAIAVAERLREAFGEPFDLGSGRVATSSSIGIAVATGGTAAPEDLLRMADQAMYEAKAAGKARYVLHDGQADDDTALRAERAAEIRTAIDSGQLHLHHQPIVELESMTLVGLEALVRWDHPVRGALRPRELLDLATSAGLAADVDLWVFERACRELLMWRRPGAGEAVTVGVNLTSGSLATPGFALRVARILHDVGLDASEASLEVSEAALSGEPGRVLATLDELRTLGVGLTIDDFGTGHSSLDRLRRCPVDAIKIHQTLVHGLVSDDDDRAAVRAILSMSEALGLEVIAEGVETIEQRIILEEFGCPRAQGYLLGAPVSISRLPNPRSVQEES